MDWNCFFYKTRFSHWVWNDWCFSRVSLCLRGLSWKRFTGSVLKPLDAQRKSEGIQLLIPKWNEEGWAIFDTNVSIHITYTCAPHPISDVITESEFWITRKQNIQNIPHQNPLWFLRSLWARTGRSDARAVRCWYHYQDTEVKSMQSGWTGQWNALSETIFEKKQKQTRCQVLFLGILGRWPRRSVRVWDEVTWKDWSDGSDERLSQIQHFKIGCFVVMKVKTKHCYNICFVVSPLKTFEAHTLVGVTLMDGDAVRSLWSLSHESEGCRGFVMFSSFFQADKNIDTCFEWRSRAYITV